MPKFGEISRYVYGTTRLGDDSIPFDQRVQIAKSAMDSGVWIHTSHQYGDALQVLRTAFDQDRSNVPPAIFKIGWESAGQIREQIRLQLDALGIERMAIGQLCLSGLIADDFRKGGPGVDELLALKDEGLVESYVLEVFPWISETPLEAIRSGQARRLLDGFIFYLNPLQRFVSNDLWDALLEQDQAIVSMRTVAGGTAHPPDGAPVWLRERASQVAPLFAASECESWTDFCARFIFGFPQVRATVGATSRVQNLVEFLEATGSPQPLPEHIHSQIVALQREWWESCDRHAEPWTM